MVMGGRANAPRAVPLAHGTTGGEGMLGVHPAPRPAASSVSAVRGAQSARSPTLEMRTWGHGCLGQLKTAEPPTH